MKYLLPALLLALAFSTPLTAQNTNSTASTTAAAEAAYNRTIQERADKILATLEITDGAKAQGVRKTIISQYKSLRIIHDARNAAVKQAKEKNPEDKAATAAAVGRVFADAKTKLDQLHQSYITALQTNLTPAQVDKVKDGMTSGALEAAYNEYLKQFPALTEEQKTKIHDWLVEAREGAMDGGSPNERHAVFGRFKGKINNYLSAAGYDLKEGEKKLKP